MGPANTLGYLLQHVPSTIHRQSDQVLQERLGIGMSQFKILVMLQDHPDVQQRYIAASLGQTEASISRQTKLLIDKGLLTIRINPKSKREHITTPTVKGIRITDAAREVLTSYHEPVFTKLSEKQQKQLQEMLEQLHEEACATGKPHVCGWILPTTK